MHIPRSINYQCQSSLHSTTTSKSNYDCAYTTVRLIILFHRQLCPLIWLRLFPSRLLRMSVCHCTKYGAIYYTSWTWHYDSDTSGVRYTLRYVHVERHKEKYHLFWRGQWHIKSVGKNNGAKTKIWILWRNARHAGSCDKRNLAWLDSTAKIINSILFFISFQSVLTLFFNCRRTFNKN